MVKYKLDCHVRLIFTFTVSIIMLGETEWNIFGKMCDKA